MCGFEFTPTDTGNVAVGIQASGVVISQTQMPNTGPYGMALQASVITYVAAGGLIQVGILSAAGGSVAPASYNFMTVEGPV